MSDNHAEHVKRQVKIYLFVFLALMVLTVATVGVSYLHFSLPAALTVALLIAGIKGSLVAGFFMHLISEKKAIYAVLILTVLFFLVLIFLPLGTTMDPITIPGS